MITHSLLLCPSGNSFRANGILCFGPSLFVSAAFCLSLVSTSLCNFLKLDDDNFFRVPRAQNVGVRAIGFWCFEDVGGSRREYSGSVMGNLDDDFDVARGLGFTANIVGFLIWLIYLFASCIPFPPKIFLLTGLFCFITCMFEGTFSFPQPLKGR